MRRTYSSRGVNDNPWLGPKFRRTDTALRHGLGNTILRIVGLVIEGPILIILWKYDEGPRTAKHMQSCGSC